MRQNISKQHPPAARAGRRGKNLQKVIGHSDTVAPVAADAGVPVVTADVLLDGLGRLLHFLFEEEANYLCGATRHVRTRNRVNYRIGYYARKFRTDIGVIGIRIPHLMHFYHRVPIVKRAKRLAPVMLESLAAIHAAGATLDSAAALVKALWTIELPDELLAGLSEKLVNVLQTWRLGGKANGRRA